MFSHRDTCKTLGGEGCPALAIAAPAENRNICGLWLTGTCKCAQVLAERCKNLQGQRHTADTANRIPVHGSIMEDSMEYKTLSEEAQAAMRGE